MGKGSDDWSSAYSNPYLANHVEEEKPKAPPGSVRFKTREEKYAEDVLKLHEAYQVSETELVLNPIILN